MEQANIRGLLKRRDETVALLTKMEKAIKAFQEVCDHKNTVDDGHDSHYNYRKCVDCDKQISY